MRCWEIEESKISHETIKFLMFRFIGFFFIYIIFNFFTSIVRFQLRLYSNMRTLPPLSITWSLFSGSSGNHLWTVHMRYHNCKQHSKSKNHSKHRHESKAKEDGDVVGCYWFPKITLSSIFIILLWANLFGYVL